MDLTKSVKGTCCWPTPEGERPSPTPRTSLPGGDRAWHSSRTATPEALCCKARETLKQGGFLQSLRGTLCVSSNRAQPARPGGCPPCALCPRNPHAAQESAFCQAAAARGCSDPLYFQPTSASREIKPFPEPLEDPAVLPQRWRCARRVPHPPSSGNARPVPGTPPATLHSRQRNPVLAQILELF